MPQRKDAAYQKKGSAVRSIRHLQFNVHFLASCDELVYYEANNKRQGDDQVKLGYLLIPGIYYFRALVLSCPASARLRTNSTREKKEVCLWCNTVVFLPLALRQRTSTRFSWKGTTSLFFLNEQKVEIRDGYALSRTTSLCLHPTGHGAWPSGLQEPPRFSSLG